MKAPIAKAYSLLGTKIYKTRIMTSQKGGFTVSSKEQKIDIHKAGQRGC